MTSLEAAANAVARHRGAEEERRVAMDLLTPEAAARRLAISEKQLRSLAADGSIRYVNIGRGDKRETRRYDPADIEAFVEGRRCQSSSAPARTSTRSISDIGLIDFQARRAARQSATRSASKKPSASASKRPRSTPPSL